MLAVPAITSPTLHSISGADGVFDSLPSTGSRCRCSRWRWALTTSCGVATIFVLMVANLIGFSVGTRGAMDMVGTLVQQPLVLAAATVLFAAAVQVMLLQESRTRR